MVLGSRYFDSLELAALTGGEPFLRPDLPEIAGFFLEKFPSLILVLLTNGFNTGSILSALREIERRWGLSRVCLGSSLDGIGVSIFRPARKNSGNGLRPGNAIAG